MKKFSSLPTLWGRIHIHIFHRPRIWPRKAKCVSEFQQRGYTRAWIHEIRRRPPNHFLWHTDDCKEIIPVSGASRVIWSYVHSVPFASANVVFTARRCLLRGSQGPVYFAKRVSPRDHRENSRENIGSNRADIASFSFFFEGNVSGNRLIFIRASSAPCSFWCVISEDVRGKAVISVQFPRNISLIVC